MVMACDGYCDNGTNAQIQKSVCGDRVWHNSFHSIHVTKPYMVFCAMDIHNLSSDK